MTRTNKIKIGDVFHMQWGYDQTNNTFFVVKKLRGATQAVIQEVALGVKNSEDSGCGPMSADYEYDAQKQFVKDRSVFVSDNDKGRIVKIQDERYGDPDRPRAGFYINHHFCSPYSGQKVYESWYA